MTITIKLSADDLAETRFAFSPIGELGMSLYKPLRDPSKHALHLAWVQETRRALAGRGLDVLFALIPPTTGVPAGVHPYVPDFLTPPPEGPFPQFEEELETVARTPPDIVRRDVQDMVASVRGASLPPLTHEILENPAPFIPQLVEQMLEYWKLAIEPHWPRIRSLCEADVAYRARQLALGGAELLFADLHPSLEWLGDRLVMEKNLEMEVDPAGRGLVLTPCVFDWPGVAFTTGEATQPAMFYSPRGIAGLWDEPELPDRSGAMDELIGGTRADILRVLEVPMTTGELARRLHLTAAAVSQQLGVLRRAEVVESRRQGREVYSELTPAGQRLLDLLG